ncbi:hypothetical protein OR263_33995 [Streptomyces sp. NEAU-H22]|uniref:hypothetical protein n=1 Tax=unclassified Streptomyces TaxID=2593676 RepID=UPI00224FCD62|nr:MULTISPECIES: hypothetical protein [unclassified Streptomyces]MCX3291663.1 hypothetical protein [Streptomyces sp. NEAU-H22]WMD04705.1 hypothetical protein Q7C01_10015 [Streptomyces sp. FXY-T5]
MPENTYVPEADAPGRARTAHAVRHAGETVHRPHPHEAPGATNVHGATRAAPSPAA